MQREIKQPGNNEDDDEGGGGGLGDDGIATLTMVMMIEQ